MRYLVGTPPCRGWAKLATYRVARKGAPFAGVVELVDTPDLGSGGFGRGGSSPSARTMEHKPGSRFSAMRAEADCTF